MMLASAPPPVGVPTDWRFPTYEQSRLPSGLRVLAYHCPGQYVVAASLLFDVPLSAEPRDREGVAELTARCLTRGAGEMSAEEFADALASSGADLEGSASPDGFALRLTVPMTQLPRGLDLMAVAVSSPTFAEEEFTHERALRLQEIDQAHAYPQHVASEELNAALFGTQRAARPAGGTPSTVRAMTRADVVDYATAHLFPAAATLILAGDFGSADPMTTVGRSFGNWQRFAQPAADFERPAPVEQAQLLLVDWPDAPQATLRVAGRALTRTDPLWPAMFVANHAVGGSFSSRINTVLREEKGYTYGATSGLETGRHTGMFSVSTAVRTDATADAVADIIRIVAAASGSITDDEVAMAVRAATQSAPLGYERAEAVVGRVELLLSQQLPLDHVDANLQRIRAVTTAGANAAWAQVIDPQALTVVVVGDAASASDGLAAWGYAELREVTPAWR